MMFDFWDFEDIPLPLVSCYKCVGRNVVLDHEAWIHGREVEASDVIMKPDLRLEDYRTLVGDDGLFISRRNKLAKVMCLHHQVIVDAESDGRGYHLVWRQP